jgi:hypothetical protein
VAATLVIIDIDDDDDDTIDNAMNVMNPKVMLTNNRCVNGVNVNERRLLLLLLVVVGVGVDVDVWYSSVCVCSVVVEGSVALISATKDGRFNQRANVVVYTY